MTSNYKLERGVKIPPRSRGKGRPPEMYPFAGMKKGDSFLVPCDTTSPTGKRVVARIYGAIGAAKKRLPHEYTTRKNPNEEKGVRIWRVK